ARGGGSWPDGGVAVGDGVVEAVGLEASCGLQPRAPRVGLLGERPERRREVRAMMLEGISEVLLAEDREPGFERGGLLAKGRVLGCRCRGAGRAGGKFLFACGGRRSLLLCGFQALA